MATDPFNLERFIKAQESSYSTALSELKKGRKESHWIWYILPQMKGLGFSQMSQFYGVTGLAEAAAYLAHPVLGPRLIECVEAVLTHKEKSAEAIFGSIDARKFQSCLSLFSLADSSIAIFSEAFHQFFSDQRDSATLSLLQKDLPDSHDHQS